MNSIHPTQYAKNADCSSKSPFAVKTASTNLYANGVHQGQKTVVYACAEIIGNAVEPDEYFSVLRRSCVNNVKRQLLTLVAKPNRFLRSEFYPRTSTAYIHRSCLELCTTLIHEVTRVVKLPEDISPCIERQRGTQHLAAEIA